MTKKEIRKLLKGTYIKNRKEYILTDENELFIKGRFIHSCSEEYLDENHDEDVDFDDCESFFLPIESDYVTKWILLDGMIYLPNTLGRNIENRCDISISKFKENVIGIIANFHDDASSVLFPAKAAISAREDDVLASDVVKTDDGYILSDSVRITKEDIDNLVMVDFGFVELDGDLLCISSQPTIYHELKIKIKPDINRPLFELMVEGEIEDHHDREEFEPLLREYLKNI